MSDDSNPKPRRRKAADRPRKPYPDFPLSPHPCGAWQKKILGRIHYFGRWARTVNGVLTRVEGDGWKEALEQYQAVADDLHAGRKPRVDWDSLTVAELCNRFLTAKQRQREAGEISARTWAELKTTTDRLVGTFGKLRPVKDLAADDFEALRDVLARQFGPVRLGNEIQRVRTVFKYGWESGLIDRPVRYGPQFKKPSASVLRRHRAAAGEKMLEADQLRGLVAAAGAPFRAMILLGLNCGYGNGDCATLPMQALDLEGGWVDYPRPKTGIARRCPLWPETVGAIREALAARPTPKDGAAGLAFITLRGSGWIHFTPAGGRIDNVTIQFTLLLKALGLHRTGVGFYTLRHVFRTVADAARDPVAIDLIMGHTDATMAAHYRERIDDGRLKAVGQHVRQWLFLQGESASHNADAGG